MLSDPPFAAGIGAGHALPMMQADAYAGFNRLYEANRKPGPIVEAMQ